MMPIDLAAGIQAVEGRQSGFERVTIQGAKAFVEEQRVDGGFAADQVRQRQSQCQTDQERLPPGQGARVARRIALPASMMSNSSSPAGFALQAVAAMQAQQVLIGQMKQVVQRQTLGKFSRNSVAFGGTNQAVQTLPDFAAWACCSICASNACCVARRSRIVVQAGAACAQLLRALRTLGVYLGNAGHDSLGRGIGQRLGLQVVKRCCASASTVSARCTCA